MKLFILPALAAAAVMSSSAMAAPERARIRGTVTSISSETLVVHTAAGEDLTVALGDKTRFMRVEKLGLDAIHPGSFIGTATKEEGGREVALEVVVFPPSMNGSNEGHFGWDKLPDTTVAGGSASGTAMTAGTVAVNTFMTNGSVSEASAEKGSKTLKVTYKGGEQTIVVPPTAPIVTFKPGAQADVAAGVVVFVNAMKDEGKITANAVIFGADGVNPPM